MSDTPSFFDSLLPQMLTERKVSDALIACNDTTSRYGLVLTESQSLELTQTCSRSLRDNGRIEVGKSAVEKLALAFCDSRYLTQSNYAETLDALTVFFYSYKNDLPERVGDDAVISFLRRAFDEVYHGSLDLLLEGQLPERYARLLRKGYTPEEAEDEALTEEPAAEVGDIWGGGSEE